MPGDYDFSGPIEALQETLGCLAVASVVGLIGSITAVVFFVLWLHK